MKTITGEEDIAKGCAINNNQILRGKFIYRDRMNVVMTNSTKVMIIFSNIYLT